MPSGVLVKILTIEFLVLIQVFQKNVQYMKIFCIIIIIFLYGLGRLTCSFIDMFAIVSKAVRHCL